MSARESIVNNIIITTIIVNLVNTITTSSPARHHHHQHHHQQQHHAITLTIPIIISSIRAQEENLSARGSGISNCVSPTNTFHPPPCMRRHRSGAEGTPNSASPGRKFFPLVWKHPLDPIGSNYVCARVSWIQFFRSPDPIFWRGSLVDPILFRE